MGLAVAEQTFVQSMLASGALSVKSTCELYDDCIDRARGSDVSKVGTDAEALERRLQKMNTKLQPLDMLFKTAFSPWEKQTFWGLSNTANDEPARLATTFSANQLALFFQLVDELMDNDGSLPLGEAQNAGLAVKLPVAEAGRAIHKFHQRQWLRIAKRSAGSSLVVFGARSLLELPNVRAWTLQRASNGSGTAPKRGGKDVSDEEEQEEEEEEDIVRRSRASTRAKRKAATVGQSDDDDEDEEDNVQMSASPEPAPKSRRRSRR